MAAHLPLPRRVRQARLSRNVTPRRHDHAPAARPSRCGGGGRAAGSGTLLAPVRYRLADNPEWADAAPGALCDLVSVRNGGRALAWNDAHFGVAANLLLPGRGADMGDGWETRRRREPGHDWCLLALGAPGEIRRVEVDTAHFKGNFPDRCSLHGAYAPGLSGPALIAASQFWPVLLPEVKLTADAIHTFEAEVQAIGRVTHVRLNIHPDGGISRLRLFGSRA